MSICARFLIPRDRFTLNVDLELPEQGITSLFGPSGCGKTSLLRAIAGLDHHQGGVLSLGDTVWQDSRCFIPPHRRPLAYVFQEASLFPHLTVKRNLEYGHKRASRVRSVDSLDPVVELLEIQHLLNRRPDTLSGGEQQRVAIARALSTSPHLLLMDEPLAALDQERKEDILPYIESLQRELKIPVIHVSHSPDEVARLADFLVLMRAGQVIATGDVHDLFTRLDLPMALGPDASAIIEARVRTHDEQFHLTCLEFPGGELLIPKENLTPGSNVRLRLAARDVSLTLEKQSETSILNVFPAVVDDITDEAGAQVTIRLRVSDIPLLARITRKSASDLQLAPGKPVFAQIKSVALLN